MGHFKCCLFMRRTFVLYSTPVVSLTCTFCNSVYPFSFTQIKTCTVKRIAILLETESICCSKTQSTKNGNLDKQRTA
jgi:hypothetical protein